jgi:hypothetical protein
LIGLLRYFSGPILAALGLIRVAVFALEPIDTRSLLASWILTSALAHEHVLPLIGFAVALGLVGSRVFVGSLLLFGIGIAGGFFVQAWLLLLLAAIPQASSHGFMTGPISYVVIGLVLLSGVRLGSWLLPAAAVVVGATLALAITLMDPSLQDTTIRWAGVLVGLWIVVAVSLTVRAFRRSWFNIFARVFGSWLIAIGFLYGGASLLPKHEPLPRTAPIPEFDRPFFSGDQTNERGEPNGPAQK